MSRWTIEWLVEPASLDAKTRAVVAHLRLLGDLTCQHGNASGACPECRNGIDPTTGDVA